MTVVFQNEIYITNITGTDDLAKGLKMEKRKTKKALLAGIAAAGAYHFIKGNGIFNKPRFYFQHKAVKKYLSSNHANAYVGEIVKTKSGWTCVVNDNSYRFVLNISQTNDGTYIFSEEKI